MTRDSVVRLAAVSAAIAITAGAFATHGVAGKPAEWLRTGGQYQLIHAVAAIVVVQLGTRLAASLLLGGSALFAATLYAMALGGPLWLGAVTPVGGLGMIAGWLVLAWRAASPSGQEKSS